MPGEKDMSKFVAKIDDKIRKQTKIHMHSKQPKWIISPEHSASNHRNLNTKLRDCKLKAILLHGERANSKFNNCRGLWPYLAQIWESNQAPPTIT